VRGKFVVFTALILSLALAITLNAADNEKTKSGIFIKYKPPMLGKPANRIGGGTRGKGEKMTLTALAPDHIGLAATVSPSLCWYVYRPLDIKIEITLNDEESFLPLLEKQLDIPDKGGIKCIKLSDYGLSLTPRMEYQWFVSVSPDPEQRSRDIVSGGLLVYKEPTASQAARFSPAKGLELLVAYADEGFWYDSMATLAELIEANPEEKFYRDLETQLLEQGGLKDAAEEINR
jgi:hypothetical protein